MDRRADEGSIESDQLLPADGQAANVERSVATAKAVDLRTCVSDDQSESEPRRERSQNRRRFTECRTGGAVDRFRRMRVRQVERIERDAGPDATAEVERLLGTHVKYPDVV